MPDHNNQFSLSVKLLRTQGETAILVTESGQEISWPINDVPAQLASGEMGRLTLTSQTLIQEDKDELAKTILNEVLNHEPKTKIEKNQAEDSSLTN